MMRMMKIISAQNFNFTSKFSQKGSYSIKFCILGWTLTIMRKIMTQSFPTIQNLGTSSCLLPRSPCRDTIGYIGRFQSRFRDKCATVGIRQHCRSLLCTSKEFLLEIRQTHTSTYIQPSSSHIVNLCLASGWFCCGQDFGRCHEVRYGQVHCTKTTPDAGSIVHRQCDCWAVTSDRQCGWKQCWNAQMHK